MKKNTLTISLDDVSRANPGWFDYQNREFLNDKEYKVVTGGHSGNPFLLRSTYMFSDMFGGKKKLSWRINIIEEDLEIGDLIDDIFSSENEAMKYVEKK